MTHNEFIAERPQAFPSADNQSANNATPHFDSSSLLDEGLHRYKLFGEGVVSGVIYPVNAIDKGITGHDAFDFSNQKEVDGSTAGKWGEGVGIAAGLLATAYATGPGAFVIPYELGLSGGAGGTAAAGLMLTGMTGFITYLGVGTDGKQSESER
jgi:hypothetical protein